MAKWQMWIVLAGLALTLSGCGGGDKKKINDSPAQLASQTVVGVWSGSGNSSIVSDNFSAQITFYFDADVLNVRIDGELKMANITKTQPFSVILDAGKKRATLRMDTHGALPVPPCIYKVADVMPPVEVVKSLLKSQMENRKPTGMDGDFRQWVFGPPPLVAGVSGQAGIDLDDSNGIRKAYESVQVSMQNISAGASTSFTASEVTIGKPDAKLFEVPKEWACVEAPNFTATAVQQMPPPMQIAGAILLNHETLAPAQPVAGKAVIVV
mmetsp:Transcript_29887/g.85609  ORF Transcript_29887/g.85609 Transcript_29887/m.85609 type:complete len:268 (-) Transcript_29887:124-927(-)